MTGKRVAHFKIEKAIGHGGMGQVFLAKDLRLQRKVALKFIAQDKEDDPVAQRRFLQEARAAAAQTYEYQAKCVLPSLHLESGTWLDSSAEVSIANPCGLGSRSTKEAGAYAEFSPQVPAGNYSVFVCWGDFVKAGGTNKGPNADHVQYTITDINGSNSTYLDQRGYPSCLGSNEDLWFSIGTGYFDQTGSGKVRITNTANAQCYNGPNKRYVNFDAIRLIKEFDPVPTKHTSWGALKARYN